MAYTLHDQLAQTSFAIHDFALSQLRLCNQRNLLWLILIPQKAQCVELVDLSEGDQISLLSEIKKVSCLLQKNFPCDKLNIALLGNVVPQLHVHVIARRFDDPYFPNVPFGLPFEPYGEEERRVLIQKIRDLL